MLPEHGNYQKSVESRAIFLQPAVGYKHTGKEKE
jgi:hypothetical protein